MATALSLSAHSYIPVFPIYSLKYVWVEAHLPLIECVKFFKQFLVFINPIFERVHRSHMIVC